jgi:hypothetical protein
VPQSGQTAEQFFSLDAKKEEVPAVAEGQKKVVAKIGGKGLFVKESV